MPARASASPGTRHRALLTSAICSEDMPRAMFGSLCARASSSRVKQKETSISMGYGSPRHVCLSLLASVAALLLAPSAWAQDLSAPAVPAAPVAAAPVEVAAPAATVAAVAESTVAQASAVVPAAPAPPAPAPPAPRIPAPRIEPRAAVESTVSAATRTAAATEAAVRNVVETTLRPARPAPAPVASEPEPAVTPTHVRRSVRTGAKAAKAKKPEPARRAARRAAREGRTATPSAHPIVSFDPSAPPRRVARTTATTGIAASLGTTTAWAPDPERAARAAATARPFPPAPTLPSAPDGLAATWVSAPGAAATGFAIVLALLLAAFAFSPPDLRRRMSFVRAGPRSSPFSLLLERPG
jgi:hypothetical protein